MKKLNVLGVSCGVWLLGACSSHGPSAPKDAVIEAGAPVSAPSENPRAVIPVKTTTSTTTSTTAHYLELPLAQNPAVQKWVDYFSSKDRDRFLRFLSRGETYRPLVQAILREEGIPEELYYLALIESGYTIHATSRTKAKGVWQFMPATAVRYGLRVDRFVDERMDPIRSTRAAAHYLKDLYNVFGSWPLAMAAYNAGEGRIMNALFRGKSRDFWELVERKALPQETCDYVPKFMGAVYVSKNSEDTIGVKSVDPALILPSIARLEIPSPLLLNDLSRWSGMSLSDIWKLNPHIKNQRTPPTRTGTYVLWMPKNLVSGFGNAHYSALAQLKRNSDRSAYTQSLNNVSRRTVAAIKARFKKYRVRTGDNLHLLAERFETSIEEIKRANGLRRNQIFVGETIRVPSSRF